MERSWGAELGRGTRERNWGEELGREIGDRT